MFRTILSLSAAALVFSLTAAFSGTEESRAAEHAPGIFADVSGATSMPIGWYLFCQAHSSECHVAGQAEDQVVLDSKKWEDLLTVNDTVNANIEGISDDDHYHIYQKGIRNWWTYPDDGKGNCNDYALLKKRLLEEAGWPRAALHLTVVLDHHGEGHLVLMVTTDRGDLILDCLTNKVLEWYQTGYKFLKRQSSDAPDTWVAFTDAVKDVVNVGSVTP